MCTESYPVSASSLDGIGVTLIFSGGSIRFAATCSIRSTVSFRQPDDIAHLVHALGVMRAALKASD